MANPSLMAAPLLVLEQISKRFGAIVVADRIDLHLAPGEALGIIGPNGAGKTTLFGIISGTIAPDSGRVVYAGTDITQLPPAQRCHLGIGRSFQIPQPFGGMSVFENLVVAAAFGGGRREHEAYESCMAILQRCRLASKANRPAGSLTLIDRDRLLVLHNGGFIADGEPQAVIRNPQVAEIYMGQIEMETPADA